MADRPVTADRTIPASWYRPSIAERVRENMDRLTAAERKAAHILLANYPVVGLETVAEFAGRANVSAPTILRFVARLGFAGYPEFQKELRAELDARLLPPLSKSAPAASEFDADDFLDRFRSAVVDNITETFSHVPPAEFEGVVGLLANLKRRVHVLGGRFSDSLARYATAHLQIIRPDVVHLFGQKENWRDQLLDLGKKDVLVLFDVRRYQEDLANLAMNAAQRGTVIVLVTDQWLSPVARHAQHVLAARISVPSNWDSGAAVLALVEAVVAATTERLGDSARHRIAAVEQLRGQ
ncbi:MAG: RpiR family transcriptional regulator [Hyphomicrobiales bacterium]|nr:MAG: RpiR family transcriptional regulator [Hyphomicrobiales bacterium]